LITELQKPTDRYPWAFSFSQSNLFLERPLTSS
jgi:hypothetical protein